MDPLASPPGNPDDLRAIVARAQRRRWVPAAAAAAVAVAAATATGLAVSSHHSGGQRVTLSQPAAGGAPPTPPGLLAPTSGAMTAFASPVGQRIFVRTAGTVTVRGFQAAYGGATELPEACRTTGYSAEVSTNGMVGEAFLSVPDSVTSALRGDQVTLTGVGEKDPVEIVLVAVTPAVRSVSADFGGGHTDTMAPVDGFAALAYEAQTLTNTPPTARLTISEPGASQTVELGPTSMTPLGAGCAIPPVAGTCSRTANGETCSSSGTVPLPPCKPMNVPVTVPPGAPVATPQVFACPERVVSPPVVSPTVTSTVP